MGIAQKPISKYVLGVQSPWGMGPTAPTFMRAGMVDVWNGPEHVHVGDKIIACYPRKDDRSTVAADVTGFSPKKVLMVLRPWNPRDAQPCVTAYAAHLKVQTAAQAKAPSPAPSNVSKDNEAADAFRDMARYYMLAGVLLYKDAVYHNGGNDVDPAVLFGFRPVPPAEEPAYTVKSTWAGEFKGATYSKFALRVALGLPKSMAKSWSAMNDAMPLAVRDLCMNVATNYLAAVGTHLKKMSERVMGTAMMSAGPRDKFKLHVHAPLL